MEITVGVSFDPFATTGVKSSTELRLEKTSLVDPALWARLVTWRSGTEGSSFVHLLDEKLSLDPGSATRLADEYIRFLALCLSKDETLAPSSIVDEAWHLHLLDTRTYFEQFCPNVLGRTLHHTPGRPSPDRDPAHGRTKAIYLEAFGHPPPADIWPDAGGYRRLRMLNHLVIIMICAILTPFVAGGLHQIGLISEELAVVSFFAAVAVAFLGVVGELLFFRKLPMHKKHGSSSNGSDGGCGGD